MKNQLIKQLSMLSLTLAMSLTTSTAQGDVAVKYEAPVTLNRMVLTTSQMIALIATLDAARKNDPTYKELLDGEFAPEVIPTILKVIEFYQQQMRNPVVEKEAGHAVRNAIIWSCVGATAGAALTAAVLIGMIGDVNFPI